MNRRMQLYQPKTLKKKIVRAPAWQLLSLCRDSMKGPTMAQTVSRNRARNAGRTNAHRAAAVTAVERTLKRINYSVYSARVARSVATKAEVHDRIRARSLAGTANFVLR
jgi:hypothetical protein